MSEFNRVSPESLEQFARRLAILEMGDQQSVAAMFREQYPDYTAALDVSRRAIEDEQAHHDSVNEDREAHTFTAGIRQHSMAPHIGYISGLGNPYNPDGTIDC